ncbi:MULTISPECIES: hypothetical protein [Citrobacter]|nr:MULTISPECIES: hypothetical protein [Citrobacter]MDM3097715.1 hypothetical protein [Citrobacter sp. Cf140]DAN86289.1 MAG TPA: hypothetical protein [Caudoviricetes sp.]
MNITVKSEVLNNKSHSVNQDDDILYINKAHKTAECANKYAHELRTEFFQLLMPAITRTDVKVAGRFTSLLNELCFMTQMTMENTSKKGGAIMTFLKDKAAHNTAKLFASYGNSYLHIANLFLRKAYGR